jgi:hypothetical protein
MPPVRLIESFARAPPERFIDGSSSWPAVAKNRRDSAVAEVLAEARDDSGFPEGVLAESVHVPETQHDVGDPMQPAGSMHGHPGGYRRKGPHAGATDVAASRAGFVATTSLVSAQKTR